MAEYRSYRMILISLNMILNEQQLFMKALWNSQSILPCLVSKIWCLSRVLLRDFQTPVFGLELLYLFQCDVLVLHFFLYLPFLIWTQSDSFEFVEVAVLPFFVLIWSSLVLNEFDQLISPSQCLSIVTSKYILVHAEHHFWIVNKVLDDVSSPADVWIGDVAKITASLSWFLNYNLNFWSFLGLKCSLSERWRHAKSGACAQWSILGWVSQKTCLLFSFFEGILLFFALLLEKHLILFDLIFWFWASY